MLSFSLALLCERGLATLSNIQYTVFQASPQGTVLRVTQPLQTITNLVDWICPSCKLHFQDIGGRYDQPHGGHVPGGGGLGRLLLQHDGGGARLPRRPLQ